VPERVAQGWKIASFRGKKGRAIERCVIELPVNTSKNLRMTIVAVWGGVKRIENHDELQRRRGIPAFVLWLGVRIVRAFRPLGADGAGPVQRLTRP